MKLRLNLTQLAGCIATGVALLMLLKTSMESQRIHSTTMHHSDNPHSIRERAVPRERRAKFREVNVDENRLLRQIASNNPVTRLHGITQIEKHGLWSLIAERAPYDPTMTLYLAEASSRVAPETGARLLHTAILQGDLDMTPELENSLSGIGDETIHALLNDFSYESLTGTQIALLEQAVSGAGTKSLGKLVHDAGAAEPEMARVATQLISSIRNPEAAIELRSLAKAGVDQVSEAAQEAIAKMESGAVIFGVDVGNRNDSLFSVIPRADQPYLGSGKIPELGPR